MTKIFIDTSTWMELAKPKFKEVFDELSRLIAEENMIVLANEIIIDEWERNKEKALKEASDAIRTHAKSALKLTDFIDDEEAQIVRGIVEKYRDSEAEQLAAAESYFEQVNELVHSSVIVPITNELKLAIAERTLTKKAPFHNSKNNFADALHFFSAAQYVSESYDFARDLLFVTANYKEFSDPADAKKLHPELAEDAGETIVHFTDNLARAFKMNEELIDELDDYHEYQIQSWIDDAYDRFMNR